MRIIQLLCVVAALVCGSVTADQSVYQVLHESYKPYMDPADPFGWPMKIKSLSADPYKFWRGSKDIFFLWCKDNASDWFADPDKFVLCHGDVHLGNIGSYPSREKFGALGFGLVDFDDSARLPFQIDLLQAYISMKLAAQVQRIELDASQEKQLAKLLVDQYASAMATDGAPRELLKGNKFVIKLMKADDPYSEELEHYLAGDQFRPQIAKKREVSEILRPADELRDSVAQGLASAVGHDGNARTLLRYTSKDEFRNAIKAIAIRTRLGSSGSQGLKKYFVLLQTPFKGVDSDIIVYLKQEIPTAAERAGIIRKDPRTPAQRIAEHLQRFNDPALLLSSWCEMNGESYWVTLKDPWSDELDPKVAKSFDDLLKISEVLGATLGSGRRLDSQSSGAKLSVDKELIARQIVDRGNQFVSKTNEDYQAFTSDTEVKRLLQEASATMASVSKQ